MVKLKKTACIAAMLVTMTALLLNTSSEEAVRTINMPEAAEAAPIELLPQIPQAIERIYLRAENLPKETDGELNSLREMLLAKTGSFNGEWSVYVKNLDSGRSVSINNGRVYAASLIKLYAMGAAYSKIEAGEISEESLANDLTNMITVSSNDAFNAIERTVGLEYTTDWCKENGYNDTFAKHGLTPSSNSWGLQTKTNDGTNYTSVEDVGRFLESVYRGECVSEDASAKMLELLKAQKKTQKIPAGVPDGIVTANKTGETDENCHDAAIVYSYECDYILVVMTTAESGKAWDLEPNVTELSALVYNYFNTT